MSGTNTQFRSFNELVESINTAHRKASSEGANGAEPAKDNQGNGKSAAQNDPTPEKDPNEQGAVQPPQDPSADPTPPNMPNDRKGNQPQTPVYNPKRPSQTIDTSGGEQTAKSALEEKAAKTADNIRNMSQRLKEGMNGANDHPVSGGGDRGNEAMPEMPDDKQNANTHSGIPDEKSDTGAPHSSADPEAKAGSDNGGQGEAESEQPKDPDQKGSVQPKGDDKGNLPPDKTNTNEHGNQDKDVAKMAGEMSDAQLQKLAQEWGQDLFTEIGYRIYKHEEGRKMAHELIERDKGAEAAEGLMKAAQLVDNYWSEEQEVKQAREEGYKQAQEFWNNLTQEQREEIEKTASALEEGRERQPNEFLKMCFQTGAGMMAEQTDNGTLNQAPGPVDENEITLEDLVVILQEMIANGEIDPQMAEAILMELGGDQMQGGQPGPEAQGGQPAQPPQGGAQPAPQGGGGQGGEQGGGQGGESKDKEDDGKKKESSQSPDWDAIQKAAASAVEGLDGNAGEASGNAKDPAQMTRELVGA